MPARRLRYKRSNASSGSLASSDAFVAKIFMCLQLSLRHLSNAHSLLRSQRSGEPGSEKNLSREECAQRRGNCLRWKVAAMKPKAQPCARQDSRQAKDVLAARSRKETWLTRHPRATVSLACAPTRARPTASDKARPPLAASRRPSWLRRGVEAPWQKARRRVGEPSFVAHRRRTISVEGGAHLHNPVRIVIANHGAPISGHHLGPRIFVTQDVKPKRRYRFYVANRALDLANHMERSDWPLRRRLF